MPRLESGGVTVRGVLDQSAIFVIASRAVVAALNIGNCPAFWPRVDAIFAELAGRSILLSFHRPNNPIFPNLCHFVPAHISQSSFKS